MPRALHELSSVANRKRDNHFDSIEDVTARDMFHRIVMMVLLQIAFIGGLFLKVTLGGQVFTGAVWTTVFIAMGTLCLGFGAGVLCYRQQRDRKGRALTQKFGELRKRADSLLADVRSLGLR